MGMMFNPGTGAAIGHAALWPASRAGSAPVITSTRKSWGAVTAVVTEVHCDKPFEADFEADRDQLVAILAEVGGRVELRGGSGGAGRLAAGARQPLSLIPAGQPVRATSGAIRLVRYLVLELDLPALARLNGAAVALPGGLQRRLMFANPRLQRLCELFADACADAAPGTALYGDSLSLALLACLQDMHAAAEPASGRGGLMPWQLRAAIQYMEENLESNFPPSAVADRARLSCSHFSRGFRQSTGWAPHQWLIRARVARAQELLIDSAQPLADIAIGVGFSDQAHFTRSFGKVVGVSPGAWRRAHGRGEKSGLPDARVRPGLAETTRLSA